MAMLSLYSWRLVNWSLLPEARVFSLPPRQQLQSLAFVSHINVTEKEINPQVLER